MDEKNRPEYIEKPKINYSLIRVIVRVVISLILIFSTPILINKYERATTTTVDPILSLTELGFEDSNTEKSRISDIKFEGTEGKEYYLTLYSNHYIEITITNLENKTIANQYFEEKVADNYQSYASRKNSCTVQGCYIPRLNFEKIVDHVIPVDLTEWDVDRGYSTTDINVEITEEMNSVYVTLLKENQVMSIEYNNNLLFDESHIPILCSLFDRTDAIFDQ